MRTLTITREKARVGRLRAVKLYIEDRDTPETTILDTPCRRLGTLKNGETQSFEITEGAVKVFAVIDKFSVGCCNDYCPIPAGSEPVNLTGARRRGPLTGNAFRFDGTADESVLANRRKGHHKGVIALMVAVIVAGIISNAVGTVCMLDFMIPTPKTYEGDGYSVTLTDSFWKTNVEGAVAAYTTFDAAVLLHKETFEENYHLKYTTEKEYITALRRTLAMGHTNTGARVTEDGLHYFEYYIFNYQDLEEYTYRVFVYKEADAYWVLQVIYPTANKDVMNQTSLTWARSFCAE